MNLQSQRKKIFKQISFVFFYAWHFFILHVNPIERKSNVNSPFFPIHSFLFGSTHGELKSDMKTHHKCETKISDPWKWKIRCSFTSLFFSMIQCIWILSARDAYDSSIYELWWITPYIYICRIHCSSGALSTMLLDKIKGFKERSRKQQWIKSLGSYSVRQKKKSSWNSKSLEIWIQHTNHGKCFCICIQGFRFNWPRGSRVREKTVSFAQNASLLSSPNETMAGPMRFIVGSMEFMELIDWNWHFIRCQW